MPGAAHAYARLPWAGIDPRLQRCYGDGLSIFAFPQGADGQAFDWLVRRRENQACQVAGGEAGREAGEGEVEDDVEIGVDGD